MAIKKPSEIIREMKANGSHRKHISVEICPEDALEAISAILSHDETLARHALDGLVEVKGNTARGKIIARALEGADDILIDLIIQVLMSGIDAVVNMLDSDDDQ